MMRERRLATKKEREERELIKQEEKRMAREYASKEDRKKTIREEAERLGIDVQTYYMMRK